MTIADRHFMRYAGAEPPSQMFKERRMATVPYRWAMAHEIWAKAPARPGRVPEKDGGLIIRKEA